MTDGRVVLFRVGNFVSNFTEEMLVEPNENSAAVTTIDVYDLTGDGKVELIVGRRDGSIQVFSLPAEENAFDLSVRQIYNEVKLQTVIIFEVLNAHNSVSYGLLFLSGRTW